MGNRLVITVMAGGEQKFSMYWHWGASCAGEFWEKCKLLELLDKDDSIETMLRKVCAAYKDSGLVTDISWWKEHWDDEKPRKEYYSEMKEVRKMLDAGIPEGPDRSSGLIAFTPYAMHLMQCWADWASELDLDDPDFCIRDCMWTCEDPSDYEDEDEIYPMKQEMKTKVTRENAEELSHVMFELYEGFYLDEETQMVYQLC